MRKQVMAAIVVASMINSTVGAVALAHVTVKPTDAMTGSYEVFTVSVPNERPESTVEVRVEVPAGVSSVTPTVKMSWTIETTKEADGAAPNVTAISWRGGEVPDGLREEFTFSAKTPDQAGELTWKAYQTYSDGTIVAWDQANDKDSHGDERVSGPFSVTRVSDGDATPTTVATTDTQDSRAGEWALYVAISSLVASMIALAIAVKRS